MQLSFHLPWLKDGRVIALAAACLVAGFLLAAMIFGEPWHLPPAWGDIPTWLATIAASTAGVVAYRVYRIEAGRDQLAADERRKAQAGKVAAWYGNRQDGTRLEGGAVQPQQVPNLVWGAYVRNASDLPVTDVTVSFYTPPSAADNSTTPEGDSAEGWQIHTIHKVALPPSDNPVHLAIDETALRAYSGDPRNDAFHRVEIEFTDTLGTRWHRNSKGRLREITVGEVN
jgi:hypothetical protein